MNYEAVFNIFLGMLALVGCVLVVIFWIVFREGNTIHPIYRSLASLRTPIATVPIQQSPTTLARKKPGVNGEPRAGAN